MKCLRGASWRNALAADAEGDVASCEQLRDNDLVAIVDSETDVQGWRSGIASVG